MPNYKCKALFNARGVGVSEVYNIVSDTIANADASFQVLMSLRLALMSVDVTCVGTVTSDTDIRGDSLIGAGYPKIGSYAGEGVLNTYNPYVTNLYRCTDATTTHRALRMLRLIPANQFDDLGNFSPVVGWTTPRNTFFGALIASWSIFHKNPAGGGPPAYTPYAIATVSSERIANKKVGRPFGLSVGRRTIR